MLFSQMQLGIPAIWLKTQDVFRARETVLSFDKRDYYTINNQTGFSKLVDGEWRSVLIPMPNPENPEQLVDRIVNDFSVAWPYLLALPQEEQNRASFIHLVTFKPDSLMMHFSGIIYAAHESYRNAFWKDDLSSLPIQLIFISGFDIPEGYDNLFYNYDNNLLGKEDILLILRHIDASTSGTISASQKGEQIVKAGLGLNESSFINLCLTSVIEKGSIDPDYIHAQKMAEVKQKGILEIIRPKITFDQIGGLENIKNLIKKNAVLWHNPDKARQFGITPISKILMVGVPGTGKSAICEATADALQLDLARTGVSQVMNSFVGQSEQNMRAVFQQIKVMAPLCVWIDEFGRDLSGGASSSHVDGGTTDRVHGEFLTGLQELPSSVFLMCAANQLDNLRPEMLRAERFDKIVFVGLPTFEERISIIKIYLDDIVYDHSFNYEQISNVTMYFTGAEIKLLIKEVKFNVALNYNRPIITEDIVNHVPKMRNILWNKNRQMIQDLYANAVEQWDWASQGQFDDAKQIIGGTLNSSYTPKVETKSSFSWNSK